MKITRSSYFKIIAVVVILALLLVGLPLARVYMLAQRVDYTKQPWQHIEPKANYRVLFAGDSTAVGTGLEDTAQSTAGLFSRDYPQAHLENHSRNGMRLKDLKAILHTLQDKQFDLAVLQIGANDIINFTPLNDIRRQQQEVLYLTIQIAKHVIILHSGNIGEAPIMLWPWTLIYLDRSLKVRDIYMDSQDEQISYIDIYTLNKGKNLEHVYAKDGLHLNTEGYAMWYSYIKEQVLKLPKIVLGTQSLTVKSK